MTKKKFSGSTVRICCDVTREDYALVQEYNQDNPFPLSLPNVASAAVKKAIAELKEKNRSTEK